MQPMPVGARLLAGSKDGGDSGPAARTLLTARSCRRVGSAALRKWRHSALLLRRNALASCLGDSLLSKQGLRLVVLQLLITTALLCHRCCMPRRGLLPLLLLLLLLLLQCPRGRNRTSAQGRQRPGGALWHGLLRAAMTHGRLLSGTLWTVALVQANAAAPHLASNS